MELQTYYRRLLELLGLQAQKDWEIDDKRQLEKVNRLVREVGLDRIEAQRFQSQENHAFVTSQGRIIELRHNIAPGICHVLVFDDVTERKRRETNQMGPLVQQTPPNISSRCFRRLELFERVSRSRGSGAKLLNFPGQNCAVSTRSRWRRKWSSDV